MAKLDSAREEIGWLKVLFTAVTATAASLIAWAAHAYESASPALVLTAAGFGAALIPSVFWINHSAYRKIRELETL